MKADVRGLTYKEHNFDFSKVIIVHCRNSLIAKILIAECPIAKILIAERAIAKILIAEMTNCQNTDC